jgi:hypothetical protein
MNSIQELICQGVTSRLNLIGSIAGIVGYNALRLMFYHVENFCQHHANQCSHLNQSHMRVIISA